MKSDEFGLDQPEGRGLRMSRQVADPGTHGGEALGWAGTISGAKGGKNRQDCRKVMIRRVRMSGCWQRDWGLSVPSPDSLRGFLAGYFGDFSDGAGFGAVPPFGAVNGVEFARVLGSFAISWRSRISS